MNIPIWLMGAMLGGLAGVAISFWIQLRRERSYQKTLKLLQELIDNLKVEKTLIEKVQEEATKK
jgi:hypothetical protein